MKAPKTATRRAMNDERGMSLIEVIVAISILGVLATATLGFLITSMDTTSSIQRRSIAVTIASDAMESVSAWSAGGLTSGRSQAAVQAQWDGATANGLAQTYPAYDSNATTPGTSHPAILFSELHEYSGTKFTAQTYIGTCYQAMGGGSCGRLAAHASTPPAVTPPGYARLTRVIVEVTWTAGDTCTVDACSYTTATLIDPSTDLEWKAND